jgi:hypothetical protein
VAGLGRRVVIEFLGRDTSFGKTATKLSKTSDRLGVKMSKVGKIAALGLGAGAVVATKALYEMGQAAMEDQQSAALLAKQLRSSADATKGQVAQTERWISAQGRALGVTDDDLRPALANLVRATGDVGKAQKLASLAMDISAGKGKDLGVVSVALAKAQNGNVAALARLGIATKDADGETLSLAAVTKRLTDQFGGAAATKANTFQGKMDRLKLVLSETGETIGYKLLPVATKLADWFLAKGIPAVERFTKQMKDGTGAGGDTAAALKEVSSAAKTTVTVIGKVVGVFSGMPGAAQKALLLAGAANVISRKFSLASVSVSSFDKTAALATAKSVALKGGLMAAGVGLATLSANSSNATVKLGAATAAAALMGGAIAGPLGAALGAGGVLLSSYAHRGDAAAAAQAHLKAQVSTVTATLNAQTGAMTKLTRTTVAKTLADTGAFTAAQKVGVSYRDVLNAALGNAAATKRVDAATKAYQITQGTSMTRAIAAAKTTGVLTSAVHGTTSAIEGERKKIDQTNTALGKLNGKHATAFVYLNTRGVAAGFEYTRRTLNRIGQMSASAKASIHASGYPGNAAGTDNWRGGMTWVGEKGPELLNLPRGSQVIPNNKISSSGVAAASQQPFVIQFVLDGKVLAQSMVKFQRETGRPIFA